MDGRFRLLGHFVHLHIAHTDPALADATPHQITDLLGLHDLHAIAGLQISLDIIIFAGAGADAQIITGYGTHGIVGFLAGLAVIAQRTITDLLPFNRGCFPIAKLMLARHLLQVTHRNIAADTVIVNMRPFAVALAAGSQNRHSCAIRNGTQNGIGGAVAGADPQIHTGRGGNICTGILSGAITIQALAILGIIGNIPVSGDLLQNRSLGTILNAQPGLLQGDLTLAEALDGIGTVEHIALVAGEEHGVGQVAAIKDNTFRMGIQHSLQLLDGETALHITADLHRGIAHGVGKVPLQTNILHPSDGAQGIFGDLGPIGIAVQVHRRADHHRRGRQGTSIVIILGQEQFIGQRCSCLYCVGLGDTRQQTDQHQSQSNDTLCHFLHYRSSVSEIGNDIYQKTSYSSFYGSIIHYSLHNCNRNFLFL